MNNDDRSDRDVRPRRRWGAYAAGLSAAVGAALAAAMIPAAPAFADPTDYAVAAAAGDAVPALATKLPEETILNNDITTLFDDLQAPFGGYLDIQLTDYLISLLPGGATGTDGVDVETFLASQAYTPAIELLDTLLGGGGMQAFDAAAADAVPAARAPIPEETILNNDITTLFDDLQAPFGGYLDISLTDYLISLLPGGATGTDGVEVETFLASQAYTPAIELLDTILGGGGMMMF
jgi:hypothetical protein